VTDTTQTTENGDKSRRRSTAADGAFATAREVRQMKMATITMAALVVLLASSLAGAETYMLMGMGSWLLDDPTYSGQLVGDFVGTFTIEIDDSAWPGQNDVNPTRFEYIWDNYFADNHNPEPDAEAWYGVFDGLTMPSTPQFVFNTSVPGGILAGDITIVIQVRDVDADEVLDDEEKYANHQFAGTLNVNEDLATGAFENLCGYGACGSGVFNFVDPPGLDDAQFPGEVTLHPCSAPVEESTWSTIKCFYR
jgi:hypothetical protein